MEEVEYNEYVQKQKQKHNESITGNIEEIDLANHKAEKFITIFDNRQSFLFYIQKLKQKYKKWQEQEEF